MKHPPLAIVTGANRGLGLETARRLAERGTEVVLGSRDPRAGEDAARPLRERGLRVRVARLDVCAPADVAALAGDLEAGGRPVDVLVGNAGISMKGFDAEVARKTLETNYFGAVRVTDALLPLCAPTARVVLVSSGLGDASILAPALRDRFLAADLTRAQLDELARTFVRDVEEGRHTARGWPSSAYGVSKVALNAFVRILARDLGPDARIRVNAVCPGWVRTDLGGQRAPRSVEEGAASILWGTDLPPDGPTGGFFRDGVRQPW